MKYKLKQKQNQRITRITESTLVFSADIAKKVHVARAVDFRGIELGKDCVFHNDAAGLTKLAAWMKDLGQRHGKTEIVFGIEPTGHYWFPLTAFLEDQDIKIVVINSHHVNKNKEISSLHKKYGVFLAPTRMDSQGVSRDEAMSSGLVPITNNVAAIPEFVDETCGMLVEAEDYIGMANSIKKLYQEPELFQKLSRNAAARVRKQSGIENTIIKEIELISSNK